ncbi:MAG: AAA family ATPase [Bryobacteraceae bacterium]
MKGERNATLYRSALKLGRLIDAGLDEETLKVSFGAAATAAGLDAKEIESTIRSGLEIGRQYPRYPTPPAAPPSAALPHAIPGARHTFPALDPDALFDPPSAPVPGALGVCQGLVTILVGEPACGKSWIALELARRVTCYGRTVIYLDTENGLRTLTARCKALGFSRAMYGRLRVLDPSVLDFSPQGIADLGADLHEEADVGLLVVDTLANLLGQLGRDENDAGDGAWAINQFVAPLVRGHPTAGLILDHVPKPLGYANSRPSRYPRGSGAKLGATDICLSAVCTRPFSPQHSGDVALWAAKDRNGVTGLPNVSEYRGTNVHFEVAQEGNIMKIDWPGVLT